jgi:hypothetical protein
MGKGTAVDFLAIKAGARIDLQRAPCSTTLSAACLRLLALRKVHE